MYFKVVTSHIYVPLNLKSKESRSSLACQALHLNLHPECIHLTWMQLNFKLSKP